MLAAKPDCGIAATIWRACFGRRATASRPGQPAANPRSLRKALGEKGAAAVCATGDDLWLDPSGASIDTRLFETGALAATAATLEQACARYRGDFLEGLEVEGEEFEDWRMSERMRLREIAIAAMSRLLEQHVTDGAAEKAIATGEKLLSLDPTSEAAYRSLMQAYLTQGARGGAIRQYQRCRKILRRELSVIPHRRRKTFIGESPTVSPCRRGCLRGNGRASPSCPSMRRREMKTSTSRKAWSTTSSASCRGSAACGSSPAILPSRRRGWSGRRRRSAASWARISSWKAASGAAMAKCASPPISAAR